MDGGRILFGVFGLLIGLMLGFMFANSLNRGNSELQPVMPNSLNANNAAAPATRTGSMPQVAEALDRAEKEPDNFDAQMAVGDLYYRIERYTDAAGFYQKANKIRPEEPQPLIKLGNAYFEAQQYENAEKWYADALKIAPSDTGVRTDLGLTFFLRTPRDLDRAIKEFQAVLAVEPDKKITLQNLALAYREAGDQENHKLILERLRKVDPNNPVLSGSANP